MAASRQRLTLLICPLLGLWLTAAADGAPVDGISVRRAPTAPNVDGHLDEAVWSEGLPLVGFRQRQPREGEPATESTEVRLLFNDHALYVAWRLEDQHPERPRAVAGRRDAIPSSDQVTLFLDPHHDHRTGYVFAVSAAGVVADAVIHDESTLDWNWDGAWRAAVSQGADGWTAEMEIPWSTLHWSRGERAGWGIHLRRYLSRVDETSEHKVITVAGGQLVSAFEHLHGLEQLRPGLQAQLTPYVGARLQARVAESSLSRRRWAVPSAGIDARLCLGLAVTLVLTAFPDFGQVELDPAVVNLEPYEVQFPERRPFFVQNQEVFQPPWRVVHTRRIGAASAAPTLAEGERLVSLDEEAPLWAAGKVVSRIGRNQLGLMSAVTGPTEAEIARATGSVDTVRATASTLWNALALRRELSAGLTARLLGTAVTRLEADDAYAGSFDLDLRGRGLHTLQLQALGSVTRIGSETGQREGWALGVGGGRTRGEPWQWYAEGYAFSREVDWNDMGYLQRNALAGATVYATYLRTHPTGRLRRLQLSLGTNQALNLDGLAIVRSTWLNAQLQLSSLWELVGEVGLHAPRVDDREMRGGPVLARPWRGYGTAVLSSNPARVVALSLRLDGARDVQSYSLYSLAKGTVASRWLLFELSAGYLANRGRDRFAETRGSDQAILARLDQDQLEVTLQSTLLLGRGLTVQGTVQWLHEAERRRDWRQLLDASHTVPVQPGAAGRRTSGLNAQVGLRWELRAGSALHLVYRHQGQDLDDTSDGAFEPLTSLGRVVSASADDYFLIKLSYLFGTSGA